MNGDGIAICMVAMGAVVELDDRDNASELSNDANLLDNDDLPPVLRSDGFQLS